MAGQDRGFQFPKTLRNYVDVQVRQYLRRSDEGGQAGGLKMTYGQINRIWVVFCCNAMNRSWSQLAFRL
jgi:hypothetical protein